MLEHRELSVRWYVSFRQNGVGTVFFMADAILPKGHDVS
jgi:hypothetical protein